jgi:integrase
MREGIWKPALDKAGIEYRPMMQTRHTFATVSLSERENTGWVQHMLGQSSIQMIFTKYYAWIPRKTRKDGSTFQDSIAKKEASEGLYGKEISLVCKTDTNTTHIQA